MFASVVAVAFASIGTSGVLAVKSFGVNVFTKFSCCVAIVASIVPAELTFASFTACTKVATVGLLSVAERTIVAKASIFIVWLLAVVANAAPVKFGKELPFAVAFFSTGAVVVFVSFGAILSPNAGKAEGAVVALASVVAVVCAFTLATNFVVASATFAAYTSWIAFSRFTLFVAIGSA